MASLLAKNADHRVSTSTRLATGLVRVGVGADTTTRSGPALPPFPRGRVDGSKRTRTVGCSLLPSDDELVLRVGSPMQFTQVILRLRVLQEEMRVVELARQGQAEILDEHELFGFNPRS